MVTAENVRHRLGVEERSDRQFGVRQASLGVGVDDVTVAGVDDLDFFGCEIGHLVLKIEDAFRTEAVEHRHLPDGARAEARPDSIARGGIDRYPEDGDVCAVELVPVGAGGLARKGCQAHEGQIHSLRHVPAHRLCCHCNVLSPSRRDSARPIASCGCIQQISPVTPSRS